MWSYACALIFVFAFSFLHGSSPYTGPSLKTFLAPAVHISGATEIPGNGEKKQTVPGGHSYAECRDGEPGPV